MYWTDYHAKLVAHELTQKYPIDSDNKLIGTLVNAQVDLNPHQVDAALFPFQSPFSKGSILADEVGLGKTIEAGLIISQKWAEDLKLGLEREIKDIDINIKECRRASIAALSLDEKLQYQKEIKTLEAQRNTKRKALFNAQDDIDIRRGELISEMEAKLSMDYNRETLFEIEWRLV